MLCLVATLSAPRCSRYETRRQMRCSNGCDTENHRVKKKLLQILLLSSCRHKNVIYFVFSFYLKLVSVRWRALDSNLCIRSPQSHFSCNSFQLVWIDSMGSRSVCVGAFQIVGLLLFRFIISSHYYGFEHDSQMNMNARSLQTATTPDSGKVLWGFWAHANTQSQHGAVSATKTMALLSQVMHALALSRLGKQD